MNEHDALQVMLVKSFETGAADDALLADAERHEATRSALETVGPRGAPDAFIAARASAASRGLAQLLPVVQRMLERQGWHTSWLALAIGIGLLVGITADLFGGGRQLNLLAPPAWLVILWNLGVYTVLCTRLFGGGSRKTSPRAGWRQSAASILSDFRFRRWQKLTASSPPHSRALADFGTAWTRASLPLATARLVTLLHTASAAVAIALIGGMYLRGLVFEYRVEWGSTFLTTQSVHALLSFLLAPALWLSGIQLPDVAQMEALRNAAGLDRAQATAAPWIHLYAIMLAITVVLPRMLLACCSAWQVRRLSAHFPLSLDEQYYRSLLRAQRGDSTQLQVLPYALALATDTQQNLAKILELAFDNAPQIAFSQTTPLGGEDDLTDVLESLAHATHIVAVFDMTATPEAEYHGAFLRALTAAAQVPVLIVVNESGFASRFKAYPQRLAERRETWTVFTRSMHKSVLFFDLATPQLADCIRELKSSIDTLTAP